MLRDPCVLPTFRMLFPSILAKPHAFSHWSFQQLIAAVSRFIISYHRMAMVSSIEVLMLGFGIPEMPMTLSHTNEPRNSAVMWFIYQGRLV